MTLSPDPRKTAAVREDLRARLHRSLEHLLFEAAAGVVPPAVSRDALGAIVAAGGGYPSALVFALHGALLAAAREEQVDRFADHGRALADLPPALAIASPEVTVGALCTEDPGLAGQGIMAAAFQDDLGLTAILCPPEAEAAATARAALAEALAALKACVPAWYSELALLSGQVLLASPSPDAKRGFGGATTFDAFGAMVLNPAGVPDPAAALMGLIHESAHQRLFLHHLDDPVLLNDAEARHVSPLRREPRPMEGVFHAAWVSARMALAAREIARTANAPAWAEDLERLGGVSLRNFEDCIPVIEAEARFTPLGQRLLADAREAMRAP